jgi:hypothetical protein
MIFGPIWTWDAEAWFACTLTAILLGGWGGFSMWEPPAKSDTLAVEDNE